MAKEMKKVTGLMAGMSEAADEPKDKKESKSEKKSDKSTGKKKHKAKSVHVRRAQGGFIAKNEYEPAEDGSMQEPTEHVLPNSAALQAHMDEHMDEPEAGSEAGPSGPAAGM